MEKGNDKMLYMSKRKRIFTLNKIIIALKYTKNGFDPQCNPIRRYGDVLYICKTCDKKLLKQEIPCQSVSNKLELCDLPEHLQNINKMERAVVSQRILFTKIKIMPKGQFPKIKGIVCNVPIETEEFCNVLPRTLDDSNVIFMKLKRKLCYNGHVLSESVRPEIVFSILDHLKNVNPLYRHINV